MTIGDECSPSPRPAPHGDGARAGRLRSNVPNRFRRLGTPHAHATFTTHAPKPCSNWLTTVPGVAMFSPSASRFSLIFLAACLHHSGGASLGRFPSAHRSSERCAGLGSNRQEHRFRIRKRVPQSSHHAGNAAPDARPRPSRNRIRRRQLHAPWPRILRWNSATFGLSDAGNRISQVEFVRGMAYVNWLGKSSDEFSLDVLAGRISLDHAAHFRVDASPQTANLAVFKGDVDGGWSVRQSHG